MPDPHCAIARIDPLQLAWAAGFFDGEGSTMAVARVGRPGYRRLELSVPQRGAAGIPEVLYRFQSAVLGLGRITGPEQDGLYVWRSNGFSEAQATIALLWRYLGSVKRAQATTATRIVRAQYDSGAYRARGPRSRRTPHASHTPLLAAPSSEKADLAWAAGFLDAEGHFGLPRAYARKDGSEWRRIRVSTSQHGMAGSPPEVLRRMKRILGGAIEKHGEPDDFRWSTDGLHEVKTVFQRVRTWLGTMKQQQARLAIESFLSQRRLRGDTTHCLRGHPYDHMYVSASGLKRRCNACARWLSRRGRARKGIGPRQFKSPARGYNF